MTRRPIPALLLTMLAAAAVTLVGGSAAHAHGDCVAGTDTVVFVDAGELGGEERVLCAIDAVGESGLDALTAAGLQYEETSASTMPLVCRIDGLPTPDDESCDAALDGDGYWAFMIATEGGEWEFAQTGLGEHRVAEDEFLAVVYTPLSQTSPPTVAVPADADTRAEAARAHVADEAADGPTATEEESDGTRIGLVVGALAVVLLLAVGFVVYRGRKEG